MRKLKSFVAAITAFFMVSISACQKTPETYFEGPEVSMGNGKVRSWVQLDENENPSALGIVIDLAALDNLPGGESGHGHSMYEIAMPEAASKTVFNHVVIDWNPKGHEPEVIYGLPHFDFHFYLISREQRMKIPSYKADSIKFKNAPHQDYLPIGYFYPGGGEAQMGAHWIDSKASELNEKPFTETFIFGTYDGKVTFYEPMITYSFFKGSAKFSRSIPRPAKVQVSGYYPKTMEIIKTTNKYSLSLKDFEYREKI
jgi:hypothetical protein